MTIFQAPEYDPRKARRRKIIISIIVVVVIVAGILAWVFRNYREERIATRFFTALQHQDYKQAYAIWTADPNWEQHTQQHSQYPFNDFYRDWGPGGEWGLIHTFHIDSSERPRDPNSGISNGVVVVVTVNNRKEPTTVFVDPRDNTISFSPFEVVQ